jgi:hypothetical protein
MAEDLITGKTFTLLIRILYDKNLYPIGSEPSILEGI